MRSDDFTLTAGDVSLHARLGFPASGQEKCPLVIIVHGYTGHMEEPHIAGIAEAVQQHGFASLRVEMYGHGQSEGSFRSHHMLKWLSELLDVIDYAAKLEFVTNLYLCGHSQGGLAVILAAAMKADVLKGLLPISPATSIRQDALAGNTFGVTYDPDHVPEELVFPDGVVLGGNHIRVSQLLPIEAAIQKYRGPVLIVHGDCDETVPYACAVEAQREYADCTLVTVRDANHCFEGHLQELFDAITSFLEACEAP